jgi:hypothetical protein
VPLRLHARQAADVEALDWIELLGGEAPGARARAVDAAAALRHALSLATGDPEAAMSALTARMKKLRKLPRARLLRDELDRAIRERRVAHVMQVVCDAKERLANDDPEAAAALLTGVASKGVPAEVEQRVADLRARAEAVRARAGVSGAMRSRGPRAGRLPST